jgi:hypothetical protein
MSRDAAMTAGPETPAVHTHRGTPAIQRLVEYAPSTGGLALWIWHRNDDRADAPAIATDGRVLHYGAAFESYPLEEQTGLVAHALLHTALCHPLRQAALADRIGAVDDGVFNLCADAVVNAALSHLGWLRLPRGSVLLPELLLTTLHRHQDTVQALLEWDVETLYGAIVEQPRGGSRGPGGPGGPGQTESPATRRARVLAARIVRDLLPDAGSERPEQREEHTREWRERLLRAHSGDGEFSLLRALLADLPRVRTPWEQVLRTRLNRGLSRRPDLSWSRPARSYIANQGRAAGRRLPWEPGRAASRAVPRLVVMVDTSASIEEDLLHRFAAEIEAISRRLECMLRVISGDQGVTGETSFQPGQSNLRDLAFRGGGGTDFTPLLEAADVHRPDMGVYLTDLDGPARFRPRWPVIWAVPACPQPPQVPFGSLLILD